MQQTRKIAGSVGMALAAVLSLTGCSAIPIAVQSPGGGWILAEAEAPAMSPEGVVESLYGWYIDYAGYDPETDTMNNPLVDGAYKTREEVAPEMVQRIEEAIAPFDGYSGYDPVLCAQDIPQSFTVGEAAVSGKSASVVVTEIWNAGTEYEFTSALTVRLSLMDGQWKIAEVICATN